MVHDLSTTSCDPHDPSSPKSWGRDTPNFPGVTPMCQGYTFRQLLVLLVKVLMKDWVNY